MSKLKDNLLVTAAIQA